MSPEVTIICITYNQANYIRDALDGILLQKTSFPFELIIHDDASTDGTSEIVQEYADKYPDFIVTILQKKNRLSMGESAIRDYAIPISRGRYVALCEGDDYWISRDKLQRQYDAMQSNSCASACIHNALILDYGHDSLYLTEPFGVDREKGMEQIILEGGGRINPTASFFFRKELLGTPINGAPVGDHFYLMDFASKGPIIWFAEPMSVYRLMSKGSWSTKQSSQSIAQHRKYHDSYVRALEQVDEISHNLYAEAIKRRIEMQNEFFIHSILPIQYANGDITFKQLIEGSESARTVIKTLMKKCLPSRLQEAIVNRDVRCKAKKDGTLVGKSMADLPTWALPLSDERKTNYHHE